MKRCRSKRGNGGLNHFFHTEQYDRQTWLAYVWCHFALQASSCYTFLLRMRVIPCNLVTKQTAAMIASRLFRLLFLGVVSCVLWCCTVYSCTFMIYDVFRVVLHDAKNSFFFCQLTNICFNTASVNLGEENHILQPWKTKWTSQKSQVGPKFEPTFPAAPSMLNASRDKLDPQAISQFLRAPYPQAAASVALTFGLQVASLFFSRHFSEPTKIAPLERLGVKIDFILCVRWSFVFLPPFCLFKWPDMIHGDFTRASRGTGIFQRWELIQSPLVVFNGHQKVSFHSHSLTDGTMKPCAFPVTRQLPGLLQLFAFIICCSEVNH